MSRNGCWLLGVWTGLEGGQQQGQRGVRVLDLGGCFDGCHHITKHRGLAIVKAETKLKPAREARVSWRLGLIFAAPDPQRDRIGQWAFFGLERVKLELAEWHRTGRDGTERAPAALWCRADLPGEGMPAVDGSGGQ